MHVIGARYLRIWSTPFLFFGSGVWWAVASLNSPLFGVGTYYDYNTPCSRPWSWSFQQGGLDDTYGSEFLFSISHGPAGRVQLLMDTSGLI